MALLQLLVCCVWNTHQRVCLCAPSVGPFRHLQRNPDNQLYPLFEYFENWCQDENRHGDFFTAVLKVRAGGAQPGLLLLLPGMQVQTAHAHERCGRDLYRSDAVLPRGTVALLTDRWHSRTHSWHLCTELWHHPCLGQHVPAD
jgi:hypothetical protein